MLLYAGGSPQGCRPSPSPAIHWEDSHPVDTFAMQHPRQRRGEHEPESALTLNVTIFTNILSNFRLLDINGMGLDYLGKWETGRPSCRMNWKEWMQPTAAISRPHLCLTVSQFSSFFSDERIHFQGIYNGTLPFDGIIHCMQVQIINKKPTVLFWIIKVFFSFLCAFEKGSNA